MALNQSGGIVNAARRMKAALGQDGAKPPDDDKVVWSLDVFKVRLAAMRDLFVAFERAPREDLRKLAVRLKASPLEDPWADVKEQGLGGTVAPAQAAQALKSAVASGAPPVSALASLASKAPVDTADVGVQAGLGGGELSPEAANKIR